jgi:hypothetical protein
MLTEGKESPGRTRWGAAAIAVLAAGHLAAYGLRALGCVGLFDLASEEGVATAA